MRRALKKIIMVLALLIVFSSGVMGFTNNKWLNVVGFEQRQSFHVDRGEMLNYLVSFYNEVAPTPELRDTVTNYYKNILKDPKTGKFDAAQGFTAKELMDVLYQTIQRVNPGKDFTVKETLPYANRIESVDDASMQFAISRGIITWDENGGINVDKKLTLGEAVTLLDITKNCAPDYEIKATAKNYQDILDKKEAEKRAAEKAKEEALRKEEEENQKKEQEAEKKAAESKKENKEENTEEAGKVAYLTFDDSVSENTEKILDILKENSVKATFFLTGKADPAILKRMSEEGHTIGNHTMTHDYASIYKDSDGFWSDFYAEEEYIESVIGEKPVMMRFPGGSNNTVSNKYNKNIMKQLIQEANEKGYAYIDWNVSAGDATGKPASKEDIVGNVINGAKNKDKIVVLMHQTKPKATTVEALPEIIRQLKAQGYEILPLTESSFRPQFAK